jgi:serine/threonine protein kinase
MSALLPKGTRLGAFEIKGHIAKGGMGSVYAARNVLTEEKRALKVMLPELVANKEFVDRFVREVRLAMVVQHPNLVKVFEPGLDGSTVFLPMELLAGETLKVRLERVKKLPPGEAVALLIEIGSAIGALHQAGIVHRDIKPSNIFLAVGPDGKCVPKLLDLGAARDLDVGAEATASIVVGSAHYMSPEQAAGRKLDARTDQYSFAVAAYQMLTGARPYENDTTGHAMAKVLAGAPFKKPREVDPSIPEALESVLLRALAREPSGRFADMKQMGDAMHGAIDDETTIFLPEAPAADATRIHPLETPAKSNVADSPSGTAAPAVLPAAQPTSSSKVIAAVVAATLVAGVTWVIVDSQRKAPAPPAPPVVAATATAEPKPTVTTAELAPVQTASAPTPTVPVVAVETLPHADHTQHVATGARDAGAVGASHVDAAAAPCVPSPGSPCF